MNDVDLTSSFVLSFREDIALCEQPEGTAFLESSWATVPLERPTPGLQAALHALTHEGATLEQLLDLVAQHDGPRGLAGMAVYLQRFMQSGLICYSVVWGEIRLATIVPFSSAFQFTAAEPAADERYSLSRFAYLRKDGEYFVLETPLAYAGVVLRHERAMALVHRLSTPQSLEELCRAFPEMPRPSVVGVMRLLLNCRALSGLNDEKQEACTLAQWEFHDLLFHARSRLGRHTTPYGSTYRFKGAIDPLPAIPLPRSRKVISLYKPSLTTLKKTEAPFTAVLEARRSIRRQGARPITVEQLGEFLYRTARIRSPVDTTRDAYERCDRPFPSAGACHELELYVAVSACEGLPAGLYQYGAGEHQLYKLAGRTGGVERLLKRAYSAADQPGMPQVLIILAARFQRVAWKYEAIAYALILKHVGVLYQTMYLVATAMGLAPCALGGGDADLFAEAAGTDYYAETSVGEFLLGSRPGSSK